jgi:hypothetical protein
LHKGFHLSGNALLIAINVLIGKYNLNTRVGHGVNVAVMKGDYNINVRYGDGIKTTPPTK